MGCVIPEKSWDQKTQDILEHGVDIFGIGDDWTGKFDFLKDYCEVVYLPRTMGISSTNIRHILGNLSLAHIKQIESSAREIIDVFKTFGVDVE